MAFCGTCGQPVNDGVKFCPSCGAPIGAAPTPKAQPRQNIGQPVQQPAQQPVQAPFQQPAQPYQPQPSGATDNGADNKFAQFNNTADSTAGFDPQDIEQHKGISVLAYFGPLVLIPMLAARDSAFARPFQPGLAALYRFHYIWYSIQHPECSDSRHLVASLLRRKSHRACRLCLCRIGSDRHHQCRQREGERTTCHRQVPSLKMIFHY